MERRTARAKRRLVVRVVTALAAALMPIVIFSAALAQTLTEPNWRTHWSPPSAAAKSRADTRAKSCAKFGPGFVSVPGAGTCIKIGGWVEGEGTGR